MDCSQLHQHLCVRRWTPERTRRRDAGHDVSDDGFITPHVEGNTDRLNWMHCGGAVNLKDNRNTI